MGGDRHQTWSGGGRWKRDRNFGWRPESAEVVADLARILHGCPPPKLPAGARALSKQLREDDALARRIWSHPMYGELITWVRHQYPDYSDAWDEMATYAISRAGACRTGRCSPTYVRAGMVDTAWWVDWRGRHGERLDDLVRTVDPDDLLNVPVVPDAAQPRVPDAPPGPLAYLVRVLGTDLPDSARELIEEAWGVAQDHYVMLAGVTGLHGAALIAAGQSRDEVNRARRLSGQLPRAWPPAVRKAMVHLFAGTSRDPGLLLLWATAEPDKVPPLLRQRWRGLVAVLDPRVGGLSESDRRRLRDQARNWSQATEIAV
jgi:hypothetical protein